MTFSEVVRQVLEVLQRQGRVSYRALQREFGLDDAYLDDVKEELLYTHASTVQVDERGLTWMQSTEGSHGATAHSDWVALQPAAPHAQPGQAERRHLTVMFSDLVDSTQLSGQLDPEDYRDVLRAYQHTCAAVIHRFDGYIAQHLGDALLVYFGFPQAHEDDAQRALLAGLGMLDAMQPLNTRLQQDKGIRLAMRVGIHTGAVVVGDIGSGQRHELLALGEAPNIASRIQGLAAPNTIAISAETYRLVQGYFICQDLGMHTLKGVAAPMQIYQVSGASGASSRLDVAVWRGLTPLVGREAEVAFLLERWQQAQEGLGHVVLLCGEGGIGKSRLVQVLKEHVASTDHTRLECRSSPYYQHTALYPITDLLQRTLQWQPDDTPAQRLATLEQELSQYRLPLEDSVRLLAPLLSLALPEERYPPLAVSPQRQRQQTLEAIVAILVELAERQPLLFIVEDLHWIDPTTLELLDLLIGQVHASSLCAILTYRPTFQPPWRSRSYLTPMTLNRLSRSQIEHMAERVAGGKRLPAEVLAQIVEKADGVPLFVEEITKAVLETGVLQEINGQHELTGVLSPLAIPATLQDSLMARLDRLVTAKAVAQYAAVIGRQFSYTLLQTVTQLDAMTLQRELGRLVEAELVYQRGLLPHATYVFKHALIQDAAYQSLLKSTRQQYHQRIAQVLTAQFLEVVETQPEVLAHHYTEAGRITEAMPYWQRAGERAIQCSAYVEAIGHLRKGLDVLKTVPDIPARTQQELALQTALGPALIATKGYGALEVAHAYTRAQQLCGLLGKTPELFPVLRGLWVYNEARAELQAARELAEQLLVLAQSLQDPPHLIEAHRALGNTLFWLGEFAPARRHLEQGIALYDFPQHCSLAFLYGTDPAVVCLSYVAWTLWLLGYPDHARRRSDEALTLAQRLLHSHSLAVALTWAAYLQQSCRELPTVQEHAKALTTLAAEQGFPYWLALGTILQGWTLLKQGRQVEESIAQLHQGLVAYRATGAELFRTYWLTLLSEAYGTVGQTQEGLDILSEALGVVDNSGERQWEAELYRFKGELLLKQAIPDIRQAETCFRQALNIACCQQAKSLELRAAMSLARLWQQQNKRQAAYDLLAPVYNWFTEGFDTADLQDAKALLDALSCD